MTDLSVPSLASGGDPQTMQAEVPAFRIAIIGSGPRGMSVLERLAARLRADPGPSRVEIHLIDAVQVGCGRIWRTSQPGWFLMNTLPGEITAFSGPPDDGPHRPGAGPSFIQWWDATNPGPGHGGDYAPRKLYGRYLRYVLDSIERALPGTVSLHRVVATVRSVQQADGGFQLTFDTGEKLDVDRAVLVTGHSRPRPAGHLRDLEQFAAAHDQLRFFPGDSAADMDLAAIPAGGAVGIIGMGLTFYDVVAALTVARGGAFSEQDDGELRYHPSGAEPFLVAGSRSGLPQPARGHNQKPPDYRYKPVFFTIDHIRCDAAGRRLDFRRDLLPRLMADVNLIYTATLLRHRQGPGAEAEFTAAVAAGGGARTDDLGQAIARFGLSGTPLLDFDVLSLPFAGQTFADQRSFDETLDRAIRADVREAVRGNFDSPVKAALDVIRSFRYTIRDLVDFGGLSPRSHQQDLVDWYGPRSAFLAAGPPLVRLRQTRALMRAGVLRVIGPQSRYDVAPSDGKFVVSSPAVANARVLVDTIVDARLPAPRLPGDSSPLAQQLRTAGLWTEFVNSDGLSSYASGAVHVTRSPFNPTGADGQVHAGLYVLGIPCESIRWFTQVVATGPSQWSEFMTDADDVAADIVRAADRQPVAPRGRL